MERVRIILPGVIILAALFAIGISGVETFGTRPHPPSPVTLVPPPPPPYLPISALPPPVAPSPKTLASVPKAPAQPPVAAVIDALNK